MNLSVLQNIGDQNMVAFEQFIKTDSEIVCQIFSDENLCIDNTSAYVKPKISQTNYFAVN